MTYWFCLLLTVGRVHVLHKAREAVQRHDKEHGQPCEHDHRQSMGLFPAEWLVARHRGGRHVLHLHRCDAERGVRDGQDRGCNEVGMESVLLGRLTIMRVMVEPDFSMVDS